MPAILHIADVHIGLSGSIFGDKAKELHQRIREAFSLCIQHAVEREVDAVVIAGDLFEQNAAAPSDVTFACNELKKYLGEVSTGRVFLLPGTHDRLDAQCVYKRPQWQEMGERVHCLTEPGPQTVTVPELQASFHAVPCTGGDHDAHPLAELKPDPGAAHNIAIIHASAQLPGKVDSDSSIFTQQELAECGMDYVALGHWHDYSAPYPDADLPVACYPGSPEVMKIDHKGDGGCLHVVFGQGPPSVELIPTRSLKTGKEVIDLSTMADTAALQSTLEQMADTNLILDITLQGLAEPGCFIGTEELATELGKAFFRLKIQDSSIVPADSAALEAYDPAFVAGRFVQLMLEQMKQADDAEKPVLQQALHYGLAALKGEKL